LETEKNTEQEERYLKKKVLNLMIILRLKRSLSANDKKNEIKQKNKVGRPSKQVGAYVSEMPIEVAKNINTMLKAVSINKKKNQR